MWTCPGPSTGVCRKVCGLGLLSDPQGTYDLIEECRHIHTHINKKDCVEAERGQEGLMQSREAFWRKKALSWA